METTTLFPGMDLSEVAQDRGSTIPEAPQPPRVRRPDRNQALMQACQLDDILPPDHQARAIWAAVERLNLSKFYEPFKARGSDPGRSGTDPKLLIALWLYATVEGIGSGWGETMRNRLIPSGPRPQRRSMPTCKCSAGC